MNNIDVKYTPSLKDHIEAYTAYEKNFSRRKIDKIVAIVLIAEGLYLSVSSIYLKQFTSISIFAILFILFGILEIAGFLDIGKLVCMIRFKTNPKFKGLQKIKFSENGLHYETIGIKSDIEWNFYKNFLESENTIILIFGKRQYSVIPKSIFKKDELNSLIKHIKDKLAVV